MRSKTVHAEKFEDNPLHNKHDAGGCHPPLPSDRIFPEFVACHLSFCRRTNPITCHCMEFKTAEGFHSQIFVSFFPCEILACVNLPRDWGNVFNIYLILLFCI